MFDVEQHNRGLVVRVTEDLDARNAQQAKEFFKDLVAEGSRSVVVDLSLLNFIDSSGLGALVAAHKLARRDSCVIRLCALSPPVRSIFDLTRLHRVFDIYDTLDEALASFA